MNSTISLNRTITLEGWRVTGTIALATKREWEPALLKLAVQYGELTPQLVVRELLGGRTGLARRLLDLATRLGLLREEANRWTPTEAGKAAAEKGVVLVPERGAWTVWGARDPLLETPIVAVTRWTHEPSAHDERGRNGMGRAFAELPDWLRGCSGKVIELPGGEQVAIRIDELGPRGERADGTPSLRATLAVSPDGSQLQLEPNSGETKLAAHLSPPKVEYARVWTAILQKAGLENQWDGHREVLWVPFGETSPAERTSMRRTLRVSSPALDGLGRFDDVTVNDVPLWPASRTDAATWAEWRLIQNLSDYVDDGALAKAWEDARETFREHAPGCPARAELSARVRGPDRPPPAYWWLQARHDWRATEGADR